MNKKREILIKDVDLSDFLSLRMSVSFNWTNISRGLPNFLKKFEKSEPINLVNLCQKFLKNLTQKI